MNPIERPTPKMKWAQLIKELLERLQITREQLAKALDVYPRSVYFWLDLKSDRQVPRLTQRKLKNALTALGQGYCEEATIRLCLGDPPLEEIVQHVHRCPICKLAAERSLESLEEALAG